MSNDPLINHPDRAQAAAAPTFRRAVLRGLALILPPLLTIVVFFLIWGTIEKYVLGPLEGLGQHTIVAWKHYRTPPLTRIPETAKAGDVDVEKDGKRVVLSELLDAPAPPGAWPRLVDRKGARILSFQHKGQEYVPLPTGKWIPKPIYLAVDANPGDVPPQTANAYYYRYVEVVYLRRSLVIPIFLCLFVLVLYFLGKFLAAGAGRMLWNAVERLIVNLPIIRNVYSSVKQVTDFFLSEREIAYTRIVAVEYPRKGIWSIGFVTGESMSDIRSAANEPVLSVLMPSSPVPGTGFTVTVKKSETVDLNITLDQAIQFIFSCGVVVPPHQQHNGVNAKVLNAIARRNGSEIELDKKPREEDESVEQPSASD